MGSEAHCRNPDQTSCPCSAGRKGKLSTHFATRHWSPPEGAARSRRRPIWQAYLAGGFTSGLWPGFPVMGLVFPFVDQLLALVLSGWERLWAGTIVPLLVVCPRTWTVPEDLDDLAAPVRAKAVASVSTSSVRNFWSPSPRECWRRGEDLNHFAGFFVTWGVA